MEAAREVAAREDEQQGKEEQIPTMFHKVYFTLVCSGVNLQNCWLMLGKSEVIKT